MGQIELLVEFDWDEITILEVIDWIESLPGVTSVAEMVVMKEEEV